LLAAGAKRLTWRTADEEVRHPPSARTGGYEVGAGQLRDVCVENLRVFKVDTTGAPYDRDPSRLVLA